jgi:hypothetical protein
MDTGALIALVTSCGIFPPSPLPGNAMPCHAYSIITGTDIEYLDDKTREQLLFPRTLFQGARQSLMKIDNSLFSELRSYRDPPKLIRIVLKGVLYLFGARPRDLKEWRDMAKVGGVKGFGLWGSLLSRCSLLAGGKAGTFICSHARLAVPRAPYASTLGPATQLINKELLQKMAKYDPTTVQKKLRFKRLRRILGVLERQEISKRGSQPAQVIHEWLVVSYELRQKAVEARARRADIFSRSDITALEGPTTATEGEEGDAEAEAEEADDEDTSRIAST